MTIYCIESRVVLVTTIALLVKQNDSYVYSSLLMTDYNVISKFLNRMLGIPVEQQNALFQYFTETLAAVILRAKRNGRFDMGILGGLLCCSPLTVCSPLCQFVPVIIAYYLLGSYRL